MPDPDAGRGREEPEEEGFEHLDHPRGTLAIVILYAVLFALGWLGLYVFEFLSRGAPQP